MTCDDVQRLLHPFVDTELPPPMLLAVARHAGSCLACDSAIRQLTELRDALVATVDRRLDGLDLSGVWSNVSDAVDRHDRRAHRAERLRALPLWGGSALALAASLVLAFGLYQSGRITPAPEAPPSPQVSKHLPVEPTGPVAPRLARAARRQAPPNYAAFDRLWGRGIQVKREPKSGTTVVLVSHLEGAGE